MKLVLASQNENKLREFREIFSGTDIEIVSQRDILPELDVDETGSTFEENALLKARAVTEASGCAAIADDSGLSVDALDGAPGIYSHRYGDLPDDPSRCRFLLKNLESVPDEKRTAAFVSAIACTFPDGKELLVRGECVGSITREMRGENGFGYDPVFLVPEYQKTFAELSPEQKNRVSHRGKALAAFRKLWKEKMSDADK